MTYPVLLGLGTALPDRCYPQEEILALLAPHLNHNPRARAIFSNAGIASRYLAVDGSYYEVERTTQARNERYMEEAQRIGEQAIERAFAAAGVDRANVDDLIVVSCTGIDTPGLDLKLAGSQGLSPWLHRANVLGMGCYGAFPGLLRAGEAAAAGRTALLLCVEICSLHFQPGDDSLENIVSSALFADGAAAVVLGSAENGGTGAMRLVDSVTYSDYQTFDHMAFHLTDHGFRMALSSYVPKLLAANIEEFADKLLDRNGLTRAEIDHWGVHPGSSKILDYVQERLGLAEDALDPSRKVLRDYGNMSSVTVLFVLEEIRRSRRPTPGEYAVIMAFGPGLTMEAALVQF